MPQDNIEGLGFRMIYIGAILFLLGMGIEYLNYYMYTEFKVIIGYPIEGIIYLALMLTGILMIVAGAIVVFIGASLSTKKYIAERARR